MSAGGSEIFEGGADVTTINLFFLGTPAAVVSGALGAVAGGAFYHLAVKQEPYTPVDIGEDAASGGLDGSGISVTAHNIPLIGNVTIHL